MRVTRRKERDQPLSDFPGWGIDIMMGLYGEEQVTGALAAERVADLPGGPEPADLDAVGSMVDRLRRLRRRHP